MNKQLLLTIMMVTLIPVVSATMIYTGEPEPQLTIMNQSGIDAYIDWTITELSPTNYNMIGSFDNALWLEFWAIRNLNVNNAQWTTFVNKYFPGETVSTIRNKLRNVINYPLPNTTDIRITLIGWVENASEGTIDISMTFPNGRTNGMSNKIGFNSTIVNMTTSGIVGNLEQGFQKRVFRSQLTGNVYAAYTTTGADFGLAGSNNNGTSWQGTIIDAGTYNMDQISCGYDVINTSHDALYCVYADNGLDELLYRRINLTTTTPFYTVGIEYKAYDASEQGESSTDDISMPRIVIGSDHCGFIVYDFEDDSLATADEHQVRWIREKSNSTKTCGDGVWDRGNSSVTTPTNKTINNDTGYNADVPIGISLYPNDHVLITWINTDSTTAVPLLSKVFNSTTNTTPYTQDNVGTDVEYFAGESVIAASNYSFQFIQNDTITVVGAVIRGGINGTKKNQTMSNYTTLDATTANISTITASYDNRSDQIYLFYLNMSTAARQIMSRNITALYTTQTVGNRYNFSEPDNKVLNGNYTGLSSFYDYQGCTQLLLYADFNTTNLTYNFEMRNTSGCGVAAVTYDTNWFGWGI